MLIDDFMPDYDVSEHHEIVIDASADAVFKAVRDVDMAKDPIAAALFAIRGIPHLILGRLPPSRRLTLDYILDAGFTVLADDPPHEIVLGVVGRFWRLDSGIVRIDSGEFVPYDEPDSAKGVMNFAVRPDGSGSCIVTTETRVLCSDDSARRKFRLYWNLIGPFSGLIRRRMLRLIAKSALEVSNG